ncbi:DNA cytosine methyltransferase [Laspinema sp. D1]|uniref:Cytosine-specific methyltransferase n=1 Tax=Laspinema palackyanum D2a TaxID=2953684 RepID=A0ABT2MZD7_9CYAN|nr:DNA cytosine methyltransferase [Laspinema sp. D2a]
MTPNQTSPKLPYLEFLNTELKPIPDRTDKPLVIDLFSGCGGLAFGFEAVGFRTIGYEMDPDACMTYRKNLNSVCHQVLLTPDSELVQGASVIIGGPPCQPFSVGGNQQGVKDSRDGFPIFINAVERHQPVIAIFENVPGMRFRNKAYFEDIISRLKALDYIVEWEILTASDYGVPQRRQRLFCIAHKGGWEWPKKTHHYHPYTAGEALGEMALMAPPNSKFLTPSMDEYIRKYEKASKCVNPRDLHLDRPSRTITCRNLSAPTGDMLRIRLPEGRRRRLTVREGARLQSFPDWFEFYGSEESQCKQIGNAVPPILAKSLAVRVKLYLENRMRLQSEKCLQFEELIQLSFNVTT